MRLGRASSVTPIGGAAHPLVHSQGWNRQRGRKGHVIQGRYKAVVMNGEERDGSCFTIMVACIYLNPVRSGWLGGETGKRPDWLETGKVLRAFRWSDDHRRGKDYAGYLEAMPVSRVWPFYRPI